MPARARLEDGTVIPVALERYTGGADETDEELLSSVQGPVLDVGCGPGRHLRALARRGIFALGVDLSSIAVVLARNAGSNAIHASIFDELPGPSAWRTALLLDGNIGIGGEPARLLAPGGEVLVELEDPATRTTKTRARIETPHATSAWFPWARVAADDIEPLAAAAGLGVRAHMTADDRWFATLVRPRSPDGVEQNLDRKRLARQHQQNRPDPAGVQ
jgi:SAM-dependent methyltransferase